MPIVLPEVVRAGSWFLHSGIQEANGGVARYYRADLERNLPVSTEITGYTLSTLVYLHGITQEQIYLERASAAADFLAETCWNDSAGAMPFEAEPGSPSYFFDCGMIVRGLLAAWRALPKSDWLDVAVSVGQSMATDFTAHEGYHAVLSLPHKQPLECDPLAWSRSPGCYHLKAAMAWCDLAELTGDPEFQKSYDRALDYSLRTWPDFLNVHPDRLRVVDRLHPLLYFLEGLLPRASEECCAAALRAGIPMVARHMRNLAAEFERCDVYAQLLRIRMYADAAGVVPLDRESAAAEAQRLAGFQSSGSDPRVEGGFSFGRLRGSCIPHMNPVSTAFALQALTLWDGYRTGSQKPDRHLLI